MANRTPRSARDRPPRPNRRIFDLLGEVTTVPGTAVYFSADPGSVPVTMLHNLKHNKVLHERVVFFTLTDEDVPRVPDAERTAVTVLVPRRAWQATVRCGFIEAPDAMHALALLARHGLRFERDEATFFLGKSTIALADRPGLFTWRRRLFRWMQRNSPTAVESFKRPPGRVIELGTQLRPWQLDAEGATAPLETPEISDASAVFSGRARAPGDARYRSGVLHHAACGALR